MHALSPSTNDQKAIGMRPASQKCSHNKIKTLRAVN